MSYFGDYSAVKLPEPELDPQLPLLVLLHHNVPVQVVLVSTGLLGWLAAGRGAGAGLPDPDGVGRLGVPIKTDTVLFLAVWPGKQHVL